MLTSRVVVVRPMSIVRKIGEVCGAFRHPFLRLLSATIESSEQTGMTVGIIKRIAVGLCLTGVVGTASAVNWVKVYEGSGLLVYVDPDQIRKDGSGHVLVWTYVDHSQRPITSGNMTATATITRYSIDCTLDRYLMLSVQELDAQGNNLGSPDLTGKPYTDIPPGSATSFVEAAACHTSK
jgi:hypothetical protein